MIENSPTESNFFRKIFLDVDNLYKPTNYLFGKEWNKVKKQQMEFLLQRPLIFKVLTENHSGPATLFGSLINELSEAETAIGGLNKRQSIEELADMTLLCLTMDSLNPNLYIPSQMVLFKNELDTTIAFYCKEMGLNINDLIPIVKKKIKTNELRNPIEAFALIPDESWLASIRRMQQNWNTLKKNRDNSPPNLLKFLLNKKDWWKSWLWVDDSGQVKEQCVAHS